jgi:transcriptional regulator with GAF, ATPase, and Fis domain
MRRHIERALQETRGRVEGPQGAARLLRINPHTLRARMRKLKVDWQRFRVP